MEAAVLREEAMAERIREECTAGGSPRASPGGGHVLVNLGLFYTSTELQYSSTLLQLCQLEISTA